MLTWLNNASFNEASADTFPETFINWNDTTSTKARHYPLIQQIPIQYQT